MKTAKILNVDDHAVNRYIRTATLQSAGYEIIEAGTGAEALKRFEEERPQLVLLDMNLPDMTGTEVRRRIRAQPDAMSAIVLHISASRTSVEDRVVGLEGGADGYLIEPIEPELLLATVRSLLRLWTAETQLEESLTRTREMAARYQSLVEAVPQVIFTATAEGAWDYVSDQFPAYTGFTKQEAFAAGWIALLHPEDRGRAQSLWSNSVATGDPFGTEYRLRLADGSYRWNLARARAVRSPGGDIVQWVGSATDINERKLLDEEVKLRHGEFVSLAEHSPDIIARVDANLRHTYINPAVAAVSPVKLEEFIGKTHRELGFPPDFCDVWEKECRGILATGQPNEFESIYKGHFFHIRLVPEFGKDGAVESLLSVTADITDRKNAERSIAESERKLRRLVESNVIGIMIANRECITFANDVFLDLVGYTRGDLEAGLLQLRAMTPPEYLPMDDRCVAELVDRGACTPFEKEYLRKDGSRAPILIGCAALDSSATEWVCFVLDLRELKDAEAALRRTNLALRRSNEDLGQFAYAASHDLQEPLRTMVRYTQLLGRQFGEQLGPSGASQIELIRDAALRMQKLIQDLLAFSHAQSAELSSGEPVPAAEMINEAMANLSNAVEESGATVTCGELPEIAVDVAQFTQVFQNLIGNAIKYRKPEETPRIDVTAGREGDSWLFTVRDNGMGFEQEYAERIFGAFKRLHGRDIPGTGIGLAIVKKIIERHDGQVWAESEPGKGSAFFFRLPSD